MTDEACAPNPPARQNGGLNLPLMPIIGTVVAVLIVGSFVDRKADIAKLVDSQARTAVEVGKLQEQVATSMDFFRQQLVSLRDDVEVHEREPWHEQMGLDMRTMDGRMQTMDGRVQRLEGD